MDNEQPNTVMENDWQKGKSLVEANIYMLEHEILCDVTFLVGENRQREPAHKYVLASRSPVFFAMFCGPLAESREAIEIPDIDPGIFMKLMRFMYADECDVTEDNVTSLFYAARKYEVTGLINKIVDFFAEGISVETVSTILEEGVTFGEPELINRCLKFIFERASDVFESEEFLLLSRESLRWIFQSDYLLVQEEIVFESCLKWAQNECKSKEVDANPQNLRSALGDVFYLIRFPCMEVDQLKHIHTLGILTAGECEAMLQDIAEGTRLLPFFTYRNRLIKAPVSFVRFSEDFGDDYIYGADSVESLSFQCSDDTYMAGINLFTPCAPGLIQGNLDLLEGDAVIHSENHRVVMAYSHKKYDDISFEKPVPLKKEVLYTLKLHLRGVGSFCGQNGIQNVTVGHTTVTFFNSGIAESQTNIYSGQIHSLLLHL